MPIISIVNIKGGVGKTITALNLAGEIEKYGRVLLIDNDSQSSLTQILNVQSDYTLYDLYSNSKIGFEDCIVNVRGNLFIVPNTIESASLEYQLRNRNTRDIILKEKWEKYGEKFDFVIIDNSPFLGLFTRNSLAMSDYYIEVIDNSPSALQGLKMVTDLIKDIKETEVNTDIELLGILRNRFERRSSFGKQFNEVLTDSLNDDLFNTIIYDSIRYKEATIMCKTIQEYNPDYAIPYKNLLGEIIHRINTR